MKWFRTHAVCNRRRWRLAALRRMPFGRRLLMAAVLLLLGQQIAMAASACAMDPAAMGPMLAAASAHSMPAMGDTCPEMQGTHDRSVCTRHCSPDPTAQPETRSASVPPSAFTLLPPQLPTLVAIPPTRFAPHGFHRLRAPPPSAILLYCSLLI